MLGEKCRLVENLCRSGNVDRWTDAEKVVWFQRNHVSFTRHHWEILNSGVMRQSERMPHDEIFILDILIPRDPSFDSLRFTVRLIGVFPTREELLILVFCDPNMVVSKFSSLLSESFQEKNLNRLTA